MGDSSRAVTEWCEGEDWCPITCTATLIGRKWHPVILHRLLLNSPCRFSELKDAIDGISSKVLSSALDDMQEKDIVDEKPPSVYYSLTPRGESMEPIIREMESWGEEFLLSSEQS